MLFEIINEYDSNMPPESVLSLINRALDITHVRGDMASMFIYGGKESLRKITMESFIRGRGRYIINEAIKNDFDVNYFNHLINEAWYNGAFDEMQNFPKDFSLEYFEKFLDSKINKIAFKNWVSKFKSQYRNLGCKVD